jgi:hypothetical protein
MNFDAKIRRQSIEPDDLLHGHIASMDATARALLNAAAMIEDGALQRFVDERYSGWEGELGRAILAGERSLDDLARYVEERGLEPQPNPAAGISGKSGEPVFLTHSGPSQPGFGLDVVPWSRRDRFLGKLAGKAQAFAAAACVACWPGAGSSQEHEDIARCRTVSEDCQAPGLLRCNRASHPRRRGGNTNRGARRPQGLCAELPGSGWSM